MVSDLGFIHAAQQGDLRGQTDIVKHGFGHVDIPVRLHGARVGLGTPPRHNAIVKDLDIPIWLVGDLAHEIEHAYLAQGYTHAEP